MPDFLHSIKQKIPWTDEYEQVAHSQRKAIEVMDRWSEGERVYSQIKNRVVKNRSYYLGSATEQFKNGTEGELQIVTNLGATVLDLIVYLLSNNMPSVQAAPRDRTKLGQIEASVAEDLANASLRKANFHKKFKNSCIHFTQVGFIWWFPFWNTEKRFGKKKNIFDFSVLNPLTTRVFFDDNDYENVSSFITTKRLSPESVYRNYDGFEARPDRENVFLPREISGEGVDDGKVTVFKEYDAKYVTTIIDGRVAEDPYEHGFDFTPLFQINNKYVINDAHGHDDIFRMLPVAQELNALISATSEIARDLGYPTIIEYNNALSGRKLPKMRNAKIPVRRTDKGEGIEYMINPAQMGPLLEQIRVLLDLFHFVSLMPKAAAGVFDSSVTSGFQARIAMQPATLSTESKKIDLEDGIIQLVKSSLFLIEKNDSEALKVNEGMKFQDLWDLEFSIKWPDNLPIDIAREIQNLVIGIQNSLTSVTQAVDKYNVLMGFGSNEETMQYLQEESQDATKAPDRALKVANVQKALAEIQNSTDALRQKLGVDLVPESALPGGNITNAERSQGQPLPEERRSVPDTAREAVTPESAGGQVL